MSTEIKGSQESVWEVLGVGVTPIYNQVLSETTRRLKTPQIPAKLETKKVSMQERKKYPTPEEVRRRAGEDQTSSHGSSALKPNPDSQEDDAFHGVPENPMGYGVVKNPTITGPGTYLTPTGETRYSSSRMADAIAEGGVRQQPTGKGLGTVVRTGLAILGLGALVGGAKVAADAGAFSGGNGNPDNNPATEPGVVVNPSEGPTTSGTEVPLVTATGETVTVTQETPEVTSSWTVTPEDQIQAPEGAIILPPAVVKTPDGKEVVTNSVVISGDLNGLLGLVKDDDVNTQLDPSQYTLAPGTRSPESSSKGYMTMVLSALYRFYKDGGGTKSESEFMESPDDVVLPNGKTVNSAGVPHMSIGVEKPNEKGSIGIEGLYTFDYDVTENGDFIVKVYLAPDRYFSEESVEGSITYAIAVAQVGTKDQVSGKDNTGLKKLGTIPQDLRNLTFTRDSLSFQKK